MCLPDLCVRSSRCLPAVAMASVHIAAIAPLPWPVPLSFVTPNRHVPLSCPVVACAAAAAGGRHPRHSSHGLAAAGSNGGGGGSQKSVFPHHVMFQPTGYTSKPPPHRIPQMQTLAPTGYGAPRQHTPTESKMSNPPRTQEVSYPCDACVLHVCCMWIERAVRMWRTCIGYAVHMWWAVAGCGLCVYLCVWCTCGGQWRIAGGVCVVVCAGGGGR